MEHSPRVVVENQPVIYPTSVLESSMILVHGRDTRISKFVGMGCSQRKHLGKTKTPSHAYFLLSTLRARSIQVERIKTNRLWIGFA